jgi:hypothetical protein
LTNDLAVAIGPLLKERPFSSCKVFCHHFRIGKAACFRILHDKLDLKKFPLRWVRHALSIDQKNERMSYSKPLLTALMEQKANGFRRIITGDESWFLFHDPRDSIWAVSRDELLQRITRNSDAEKCLVSILCSVNKIHSLLDVAKATTYNTAFVTPDVIPSSTENVGSWARRKVLKGWLLLMDIARPLNSGRAQTCIEALRAERLPHPAYSSELASSDFFLFGSIIRKPSDYIVRAGRTC